MDYNKSGAAKAGKNAPRHSEHNAYGTNKKPFGARPTKQDLLARMKKAGQPDKTGGPGKPVDIPADPADDFAIDEADGKPMRGPEDIDG